MSQTVPLGSALRVDVDLIIKSVRAETLLQTKHFMGELLPAESWM